MAQQPASNESTPHFPPLFSALFHESSTLTFEPQSASSSISPSATAPDDGSLVGSSSEDPTASLLFGTEAAENLESRPLEARFESPPLLWSTVAAEKSLDANAEDPTYFTFAGFVNTIIENKIQVGSITDENWLIEEMRVAILERLKNAITEDDLTDEDDSDEVNVTQEHASKKVKVEKSEAEEIKAQAPNAKEDSSESNLQKWEEQGPDGWLK